MIVRRFGRPFAAFGGAMIVAAGRFPLSLACCAWLIVAILADRYPVLLRLDEVAIRDLINRALLNDPTVTLSWREFPVQTYYLPHGDMVFCVLGFFAFLAIRLAAEARGWSRPGETALHVAFVAMLAAAVFLRDIPILKTDMGLLAALILAVTVAPFVGQHASSAAFWSFNRALWRGATLGLLVAFGLAIGIAELITALLPVFREYRFYAIDRGALTVTWAVALAGLWPWIALSKVPRDFAPRPPPLASRWFGGLVTWGLVPLAVYGVAEVCVALGRAAAAWSLPQGGLAWTIASWTLFGVLVYLLTYPLRETGRPWVRLYRRLFPYGLLGLAAALLLAGGVRVADYGLTEFRYYLLLLALWMAAMAVVFVARPRTALPVMPASLVALLALGSIGPWGAQGASVATQKRILDDLLVRNGLLVDGLLVPAGGSVRPDEAFRVVSVSIYLSLRSALDHLVFAFEPGEEHPGPKISWLTVIDAADLPRPDLPPRDELVYGSDYWPPEDGFDLEGFVVLIAATDWADTFTDPNTGERFDAVYRQAVNAIEITGPDGATVSFDFTEIARDVLTSADTGALSVPQHQIADGRRISLAMNSVSVRITEAGPVVSRIGAHLLVDRAPFANGTGRPNEERRSP